MSNSHIKSSLRRHIMDHVVGAVNATPFLDDPFPHVVVRGFFPKDVYADLQRLLPAPDAYEPFSYEKHNDKNGESNRKRFCLESKFIDKLPSQQRDLWYAIRSVLGSVDLKEAVFNKLRTGLTMRYGNEPDSAHSLPGFALPELFRETATYHIKPHPDTRKKVVTMQIALPTDDSQEALGTEFYKRSLWPGSWLREPVGFEIVKTMPFLPNTTYAFVVLNTIRLKSWHGRSTLTPMCGVRNSILNIWYAKAEDANREIVAENEAMKASRKAA